MGWYKQGEYWLQPVLRFIGPIPAVAWIPIVMILFPSSFLASIFLVALSAWFPVTILTWSGVASVSKTYLDVARTLGAGERVLLRRVVLPAALPSIFIGLFMGLGLSFTTLVVAEMLGVKAGLGWYLSWAQGWAEYDKVYGALLIMALIFSALLTVIFRFRDRFLAWQRGLIKW
ncbi:MAG TPA: ABC transporter permease subunit [Firmicutes bacterium]|nr:ABC transporter permease subunit [Bacillota bacterium]